MLLDTPFKRRNKCDWLNAVSTRQQFGQTDTTKREDIRKRNCCCIRKAKKCGREAKSLL